MTIGWYWKKHKHVCLGIFLIFALAFPTSYFVDVNTLWYTALRKPSWQPPSWVFSPVWTFLYLLLGVVAGQLWRACRDGEKRLFSLFCLQQTLNFLWSPVYWKVQSLSLSCVILAAMVLIVLSMLMLLLQRPKLRMTFILLLPYALWLSFALSLNVAIFALNR